MRFHIRLNNNMQKKILYLSKNHFFLIHLLFLNILVHFYNLLNHHKYMLNQIAFLYYLYILLYSLSLLKFLLPLCVFLKQQVQTKFLKQVKDQLQQVIILLLYSYIPKLQQIFLIKSMSKQFLNISNYLLYLTQQLFYNFQQLLHIYLDILDYILIENKPIHHHHLNLLLFLDVFLLQYNS